MNHNKKKKTRHAGRKRRRDQQRKRKILETKRSAEKPRASVSLPAPRQCQEASLARPARRRSSACQSRHVRVSSADDGAFPCASCPPPTHEYFLFNLLNVVFRQISSILVTPPFHLPRHSLLVSSRHISLSHATRHPKTRPT